jgi:GT2 family glycosyltransferase
LTLPLLRRPPLVWLFEDGATVRHHLMADTEFTDRRPVVYLLGACQLFRSSLGVKAGPFDPALSWGPDDADWCLRIRDAGGEIVYLPDVEVIHSYRRITRQRPFSVVALRHLKAFVHFQWKYRRRRRALIRLGQELDHA